MSINTGGLYSSSPSEVVIAVDFGTTFSGFAYAKTPDSDTDTLPEIFDIMKWRGDNKAGAVPYCKNQTSLFYTPNPTKPGQLELQEWGWSAFNGFSEATAKFAKDGSSSSYSSSSSPNIAADALNMGAGMANKVGFFAHKFKLYLSPKERENPSLPPLPGDLTAERMVVDYLRKLTDFIMEELRFANAKGFSKEDVQWCLTVPAIWDEQAKQVMRTCAEKAGMVKGAKCPRGVVASPRALQIILEPEAASMYCQSKAPARLKLDVGDRILVADVGGGTVDLVVHQIEKMHPKQGVTSVREVVASYGDTGGGTFVDSRFFELLCQKIGCFAQFCRDTNPSLAVLIYRWWQGIKTDFDGPGYTAEFSLTHSALGEAWKKHDREHGILREEDFYKELSLDDTEILSVFDPEVEKVLQLIEKEIQNVRVLMVVGGFAGSQYLRKRVFSRFQGRVEEIIIPDIPGRAICRGAVQLQVKKGYIKSRISKKTYGICTSRDANYDDPPELITVTDGGERTCGRIFSVFVRAGASVDINASEQNSYCPLQHGQRTLLFPLYSSPKVYPSYTSESDAREEGRFEIDISQDMALDMRREVEVTMLFGDSLISVSATRRNFGDRQQQHALSVSFEHT
ncbi:hypothetical protein L7F22_035841 [Adiantum nelumboides]|nr:hypothetical protein [Adiantum nelumboides]